MSALTVTIWGTPDQICSLRDFLRMTHLGSRATYSAVMQYKVLGCDPRYGFIANIHFYEIDTPLKQFVTSHPNLIRHCTAIHAAIR
jgi:hypothetical protein